MPYEVTKIEVFETQVVDGPGKLGEALKPVADAGISVQNVWGWTMSGKGAVRIGLAKATAADKKKLAEAGFKPLAGAALTITGPDKRGGGAEIGAAIGAAGVSMDAMTAVVLGSKAGVVVFFTDGPAATKAAAAIKKIGAAKKAVAKKPAPKKAAAKKPAVKKAAPKKAAAKKAAPKKAAAPK